MNRLHRFTPACLAFGIALCMLALSARAGDAVSDSQTRLLNDIKYLASDELEGRGVGTKGLDVAGDFIKAEFEKAGLKVIDNTGANHDFEITTGAQIGSPNAITIVGPKDQKFEPKLGTEFTPLSFGGTGPVKGELVFLGYAIDAPDKMYSDFEGIDVKGKVLLVMRREPQQGNPHGSFGDAHGGLSTHAEFRTKISNAFGREAAAVIFVDDPHSAADKLEQLKKQVVNYAETVATAAEEFIAAPADDAEKLAAARKRLEDTVKHLQGLKEAVKKGEPDELIKFGYGGNDSTRSMPILQITRGMCDQILKAALNKTLLEIETAIDKDLKPQSAVLTGWTVDGTATIDRQKSKVHNVVAVLEGEGPLADETIVIGAHYDHVGMGGTGSLAPAGSKEVHNGADDNASGAVSLIELARRFAGRKEKLPRRLVFIAFTGEELGLLGSAEYVKTPVFPLEKTIAMFNMDMVGRLQDEKLTIFGTGTAKHWAELVEKDAKADGFQVTLKPEGFGPSDHSSFYSKQIPVLHFFTGNHTDYHRPGDDWDKINIPGMTRVVTLIEKLVVDTANRQEKPEYVAVKNTATPFRGGSRPYFGAIPDFGTELPGLLLSGVGPGGPAEKGGLKGGDRIVEMGKFKIGNLEDFDLILRKFEPGQTVDVTVVRGNEEVKLKVTLEKPR